MKHPLDNQTVDWCEELKNKGGLNELALFAGAGGGILGSHLLGWNTICAVERDAYASQVLAQRQNDGFLKPFPIWSDITTFDGKPWKGIVDVISGGFPCQDISIAGKGAGLDGERSGLRADVQELKGAVDLMKQQVASIGQMPAKWMQTGEGVDNYTPSPPTDLTSQPMEDEQPIEPAQSIQNPDIGQGFLMPEQNAQPLALDPDQIEESAMINEGNLLPQMEQDNGSEQF